MRTKKLNSVQLKWHSLSVQASLERLKTSSGVGLRQHETASRREKYGPNRLPTEKKRNALLRFLLHFHNILIYVLLASAMITASLGHWIDTGVILAVVIVNAIIGFIQEGKAEKSLDAIRQMLAPRAHVIRDGVRVSIIAAELVPGDIVLLEAGDRVPADLRLLAAHGLSVQEAILTGESLSAEKQTEAVDEHTVLGDRFCMAFSGTLVTSGQGKGVVVATGTNTEIGQISRLLATVKSPTTPLVKQMDVFARGLTIFILVVAALLLVYGYFYGHHDFSQTFMSVVGLSVAAIPEGLPAVLTITLAIGVQAMAKRHAIVRRLPAIETLGSVSVICTDKTGTLTRNEMMVVSVLTSRHLFTLEGDGYAPEGMVLLENACVDPLEHITLEQLARAAALCNDAALHERNGVWHAEGDPMEAALLAFAGKMDLDARQERAKWTRTDIIPFNTQQRFMATLNHDHEQHAFVFVKGAPESILPMCHDQRSADGNQQALNASHWQQQAEVIAAQGQRVLAFAMRSILPKHTVLEHTDVQGKLTLLGLVGMIDPPRIEAVDAVAECYQAGIQVKMITGDHAKTATAIGKKVGLKNADQVLTGAELERMDDRQIKSRVLNCNIFARTSSKQKLRLVSALQAHNMTVAMTGDGVNDAPALKQADIGIAMGLKGSDAAKEAAELVLADDNFASIVTAIREGRTVYDNLKKVISWTLPTSTGEAMTIIVALLFGMTLPVTPVQILWINLITTITLGIALAFEPTEGKTMHCRPRLRNEALLSGELLWHIVFVSMLFLVGVYGIYYYAIDSGYSVNLARTLTLNTLVVMEIFHLFFIRNIYGTSLTWKTLRGTKVVWLVVFVITVLQFAITYLPSLQAIFGTVAIQFRDGALVVAVGVALFTITEIEKQIRLTLLSK
ncbi:cation-transporting P-type ATPase [Colwelliaceae bacterium 6471]